MPRKGYVYIYTQSSYIVEQLCLKIIKFFLFKYWQEELIKLIKYVDQTSGMSPILIAHIFLLNPTCVNFIGFDPFQLMQASKQS